MTQKGQVPELVATILEGIEEAKEAGRDYASFELKGVPPWVVARAIIQSLVGMGMVAYALLAGGLEEKYYERIYVDLTRSRDEKASG